MSILSQLHRLTENKILAALHSSNYQHFFSQLEHVTLTHGEVIYEAESEIEYVYFPVTAVFSMLASKEDGDTVEVGPVGDAGMVGLNVFF